MKPSDLNPEEYNPYYHNYILSVGEVELLHELVEGKKLFHELINSIPEGKLGFAYAEGKWTLAELLMHIIDAERVFQYRALRFARNDKTPLAGFDQDDYIPECNAGGRSKKDLLEEYAAVRESTIKLFQSFDDEMLKRVGNASGSDMSARAMGFIICGHQAHHLKIIKERYL